MLDATKSLPIDAQAVTENLSANFIWEVPPEKLNDVLSSLTPEGGLLLTSIESSTPSALVGTVGSRQGPLQVSLSTQADGKIQGLLFKPVPTTTGTPTSWGAVDQRLAALAPQVGMLSAEVEKDGSCTPVHALNERQARPTGSMFKVYVLGAVAHQIDAGQLKWDQRLEITEQVKSLPTGVLQDEPAGTMVGVADAATKMISISDNTAADLLAQTVGRAAVESTQHAFGSTHAERNVPFLRTKELFVLKCADYPKYADAYLQLSPEERSQYLSATIDPVPRSKSTGWQEPRDIEKLEWFASPQDLCKAFAALDSLDSKPGLEPISTIMSTSDGGLGLDPKSWPSVWFKGGAEQGVLSLGWKATNAQGRTFVTVMMTANPKNAINAGAAASELASLTRGAFALAQK